MDTFRLFHVAATGDLTLDETTVTGGLADDGGFPGNNGGGVLVYFGTASIVNSTISGNSAYSGGGIGEFSGALTVAGSTMADNSAYDGGGILSGGYGAFTLTDSTVSGNSAVRRGGGTLSAQGTVTLTDSTISGNTGPVGGGIYTFSSTLTLSNSTVTRNTGSSGGGIASFGIAATLTNTIVANQVAGADCHGSPVTSNDYNLDSDGTCNLTQPNDIPSGSANLGPLALNPPGTTATHALLLGSDALDAGDCSGGTITTDQRGVSRPQDGDGNGSAMCDIGAFEREAPATPTPPPTATPATQPPTAAQVTGFRADAGLPGRVTLTWETASEVDVAGFNVSRATGSAVDGPWTKVNRAFIPARGNTSGGAGYALADAPGAGAFRYRLEVVNAGGPPQTVGPVAVVLRVLRTWLPWVGR